jgi:uncharacterized protein YcgI (DUF1989 family)
VRNVIYRKRLEPKTGVALQLPRGQVVRVTDVEGKQVVDMAVFNAADYSEKLSTSYSRTRSQPGGPQLGVGAEYLARDYLAEGDVLLSNLCRPMMAFLKETAEPKGVHDTHNSSCNSYFYESYGFGTRDGCHEILSKAVAPYGIRASDLPDTMDLFMNWQHDCDIGGWVIREPVSRPGDYVEFRAKMDCLIALSNCPDDVATPCNAYRCTPMEVEIYETVAQEGPALEQ